MDLKSQSVCLEDDATFTVKCSGLPLPTPTWYKKGVEQKASDKVVIKSLDAETHTITFKDLVLEDYGKVRRIEGIKLKETCGTNF